MSYVILFQALGSITWPTCEITHCISIPEFDGFKSNITIEENGYVPIGGEIFYSCSMEDYVVNDTSLSLVSTCLSDGTFSEINDWPTCRGAISCPTSFPVPANTTYLEPTQSGQLKEYEYAFYSCKDGATLEGKVHKNIAHWFISSMS